MINQAHIIGLATATPPGVIEQPAAATHASERCCRDERDARLLRRLYAQTGVDRRGSTLLHPDDPGAHEAFFPSSTNQSAGGPTTRERLDRYRRSAPTLARQASTQALADARVEPGQITHLVTVSCTGAEAPGFDVAIIASLGLPPTVERTHVGFMGCHGALNGMRIAKALAESRPSSTVLLVAVELCSLHFQYGWNPERIVANALFADGAGAAVIRAGQLPTHQPPTGDQRPLQITNTGARLFPDSTDAMTWRITDSGFAMTLSPQVPGLIRAHLRPWISAWLDSCGVGVGAIGSWAIHPGGPRIVSAAEQALGLTPTDTRCSRRVLREHGNMSSPTILFILNDLLRAKAPRPIVALGFGPGLAVEATLLQ